MMTRTPTFVSVQVRRAACSPRRWNMTIRQDPRTDEKHGQTDRKWGEDTDRNDSLMGHRWGSKTDRKWKSKTWHTRKWIMHSSAVSQFRVCILRRSMWRPVTPLRCVKAVPIWRLLQLRASFPCFCRMQRYCPSWPQLSRFFACP